MKINLEILSPPLTATLNRWACLIPPWLPLQKGPLFYDVRCDLSDKNVHTAPHTEDSSKLVIFMMQISEQNEPINQISNS